VESPWRSEFLLASYRQSESAIRVLVGRGWSAPGVHTRAHIDATPFDAQLMGMT
jgi:hypothetical protein